MSSTAVLDGTQGDDSISLTIVNGAIHVTGLAQDVDINPADGIDQLVISGQGGNDTITASNGFPAGFGLTLDGGNGNDTLVGSDQNDTLIGGSGNDIIRGGRGNDTALMGSGNDTYIWNPGDGNDAVQGQSGSDTLQFNGANVAENIDISANGADVRFTRDVANITMDLNSVETINFAALGGADNIHIHDLTGTGVKQVNVDLGTSTGAGDGALDTVTVDGSATAQDTVKFTNNGNDTVVTGLSTTVHVLNAESTDVVKVQALGGDDTFDLSNLTAPGPTLALDGGDGTDTVLIKGSSAGENIALQGVGGGAISLVRDGVATDTFSMTNVENLLVQGQGGDDTITASNGFPAGVAVTLDGGAGNDTLIGSDQGDTLIGGSGNDVITGARGNDHALMGSGNDTYIWNPGDGSDIVEGQSGSDTLQFNGANVAENINISANGGDVTFTRDVASITMDLNSVETINFAALGGADNINIHDLTGTGVKQVNVDLGTSTGAGDGALDTVSIDGSAAADDTVKFVNNGNDTVVTGLSAAVHVLNAEPTDVVKVQALGGSDTFDLSNLTAAGPTLALDGGDGTDTVLIKGSSAGETLALAGVGGGALSLIRDGVATDTFSMTNVENLLVRGQGGDDTITASNGFPVGVAVTLDGGAGNDTLIGSDQGDTLIGGSGNDVITGARGNDHALMGSGNDTYIWNPGDGSDIVEGQSGSDTLQFNGANVAENINISANGGDVTFTRDVASITMDLNSVETINFAALGGADNITVHDLTGTGTQQVNVDLSGFGGGGDGAADHVTVMGTDGNDAISLATSGGATLVNGLSAAVHVLGAESANDTVTVAAGSGNDVFDLSNLTGGGPQVVLNGEDGADTALIKGSAAGDTISVNPVGTGMSFTHDGVVSDTFTLINVENLLVQGQGADDTITASNGFPPGLALTLDGGGGNDTLIGSDLGDTLVGGDGNDVITGGRGNDFALMGSGNDTYIWNPGDGSDTVQGGSGSDTLQFNGANVSENVTIAANGGDVSLHRDVASITMDLNGVETINFAALGGADNISVGDLSGTDARQINIDLGAAGGVPDGQADTVSTTGTDKNDSIKLTRDSSGVNVSGLRAQVSVSHGDGMDTVAVHAGAGNDRIDASKVAAGGPTLLLDGGAGNDTLIGSAGKDVFLNGETIIGFDASQDQIDLRDVAAGQSSAWVLAQGHDDHGNVVFDFGSTQVTLVGEHLSQLNGGDFLLG